MSVVRGLVYLSDLERVAGPPMLGRSKSRGQTKSDPLYLQVGVWALDQQSSPIKSLLLRKEQQKEPKQLVVMGFQSYRKILG